MSVEEKQELKIWIKVPYARKLTLSKNYFFVAYGTKHEQKTFFNYYYAKCRYIPL